MELLAKIIIHINRLNLSKFNIQYGIHRIGEGYIVSLTKNEIENRCEVNANDYKEVIDEAVNNMIDG